MQETCGNPHSANQKQPRWRSWLKGQTLRFKIFSGLTRYPKPSVSRIIGAMSKSKKTEHHDIVKRLYELGHSKDQLTNTLLALMVSAVELSLGMLLLILH